MRLITRWGGWYYVNYQCEISYGFRAIKY